MTQEEAYKFCYNLDSRARLLEIHNEEELDYLRVLMNHEGNYFYWLGGTDRGHEGTWIWENSMEPVADFVWNQGEPNGGINGNCMQWYYGGGGVVGDTRCDYSGVHPLCQIPL